MATKKRSGEEINDRQILCGMGIKLRRLTAGICLITQLAFPMAAAAQGVVNAATQLMSARVMNWMSRHKLVKKI
ncbi:hypothetical protein VC177_25930 [Escherichia coli]|nr:hypothetical protein [Escherichia coli]MEA9456146.1 hypothetical protein [Escherichia coli]